MWVCVLVWVSKYLHAYVHLFVCEDVYVWPFPVDAIVVALVLPPYFSLCASALVYLCVLFLVAFVFAHCSLLFLRIVTKFEYLFFLRPANGFFSTDFRCLFSQLSFALFIFLCVSLCSPRLWYRYDVSYCHNKTKAVPPARPLLPHPFCEAETGDIVNFPWPFFSISLGRTLFFCRQPL